MIPRQIYLRKIRKNSEGINVFGISGMIGKNDDSLYTVGTAEQLLLKLLANPTFFTKEKRMKIKEKFLRVNFRPQSKQKTNPEIRTSKINRTQKLNGDEAEVTTEELREVAEEYDLL